MATDARELRLILLIDLDADPITGSLETADGRSRFGLTAALNAIRSAEAGVADRRDRRAPKDT